MIIITTIKNYFKMMIKNTKWSLNLIHFNFVKEYYACGAQDTSKHFVESKVRRDYPMRRGGPKISVFGMKKGQKHTLPHLNYTNLSSLLSVA